MLTEQWLPIKGYEGHYEISNFGRVKALTRKIKHSYSGELTKYEKILKGYSGKNYYHTVALCKDGKQNSFNVHALVWNHFGDGRKNGGGIQIDHIDNNKKNNRIDNLQLLTARQNKSKCNHFRKTSNLPMGIRFKKNRYEVDIRYGGKKQYLGRFDTIEEASNAYQQKLKEIT